MHNVLGAWLFSYKGLLKAQAVYDALLAEADRIAKDRPDIFDEFRHLHNMQGIPQDEVLLYFKKWIESI